MACFDLVVFFTEEYIEKARVVRVPLCGMAEFRGGFYEVKIHAVKCPFLWFVSFGRAKEMNIKNSAIHCIEEQPTPFQLPLEHPSKGGEL